MLIRRILQRMHIIVRQAEVMANLVDGDVRHQLFQRDIAALAPFRQDRHAKQLDPVRQRTGLLDALQMQRGMPW